MKIHAIQTGIVHVKSDFMRGTAAVSNNAAFMYRLMTDKQWIDLPIYAWAIEHEERVIIIDTGDLSDTHSNFISQSTYTIEPQEEIRPQLERLGIKPRDVSQVILTHIHGDHINGVKHFKGNNIYLGADEYAAYKNPLGGMFMRRTTRLPEWFDPKSLTKTNAAFGSFDHYYPLTKAGDIVAVPTPGHTAGHISVIAINEGISYFFAGDVSYDEQALIDQKLQGPSMAQPSHIETLRRVLQYVESNPTVYLPAHDWKSGERLANRQVVPATAAVATI
jgi:N-acyl homoserine lactone hydrolase